MDKVRGLGPRRRMSVPFLVGLLVVGLGGGTAPTRAAAGDPPRILFAGELLSAPEYDHLVLVYNTRLDQTIPITADDFDVTIDGTLYDPDSGSYLGAGFAGAGDPFDESGTTFIRLDLPAGVTIGATSDIEVSYDPGATPLRDLSLTAATTETVTGEVFDAGGFGFIGAVVDTGNATNRLTLIFAGQVDLGSIPARTDFAVTVAGSDDEVLAVEPRVPDLGLGLVDLVLEDAVRHGDVVDFTYTPGTEPFRSRQGGVVLDAFSQGGVSVFVPPTSASAVFGAGGGTVETSGDPPSSADPLTTAVTSPIAGTVTIDEAATDPAPAGYTFFGEQVVITAPIASQAAPLVLTFEIDRILVPTGEDEESIVVLRNGVPVAACDGPPGQAFPTTCIFERAAIGGGDIRITVLTVAASRWNFAVVAPYAFGGFRSPVDGGGVRNAAKAGSAIPIKFSLGGDRGRGIFAIGSPGSTRVTCDTAAPLDEIEETATSGASTLSYSAGSDTYHYVWKTDKAWKGTCRTLTLTFGDGSQAQALFQFK